MEKRCRELLIEAPAPDRIDRVVRATIRVHEERFHATVMNRLAPETRERLEALLRPAGEEAAPAAPDPPTQPAPALLLHLRGDPGKPGLAGVQEALSRLKLAREIALPPDLFDNVLPHELERYRQRVFRQKPPMSCAAIRRRPGLPGSRSTSICAAGY